MAILYKPGRLPFDTGEEVITEQEHKNSCDINLMIRSISRGQAANGSDHDPQYGYDDMNVTGLSHRIMKQELEDDLSQGPKEFTQEELDLIPKSIQDKFGFKLKVPEKPLNDDKTTKNGLNPELKPKPIPTPDSQPSLDDPKGP